MPAMASVTGRAGTPHEPPAEVLLEYRRVGAVVKVTAVDPLTRIEVSIQGPASAGEAELRRIAVAKLAYRIASLRR